MEAKSQRLKRDEANDKNQDKNAIAADNWYRPHIFALQNEPPETINRSVTPADEQDAANDKKHSTQSPITTIDIIPGWREGRLTNTENASTIANVRLQGITKPMIVTKKQKAV